MLEGGSGSFNMFIVKPWVFLSTVQAVFLASYDNKKLVDDRKPRRTKQASTMT